jgi:hypothetical protein
LPGAGCLLWEDGGFGPASFGREFDNLLGINSLVFFLPWDANRGLSSLFTIGILHP